MKHQLKLFSFIMIVVGLVIGMGIFRTAATSAKYAIEPSVYFSAWIVGGIIAFCGALTYAEIGSRYPVTGGYYKVFSYAYHPSIAFAINCIILVSNAASLSSVALIGVGYFTRLFPEYQFTNTHIASISAIAIVLFYFINLKGLKLSATAQNILMLIKIGMLLLLVGALLFPNAYATNTTPIFSGTAKATDWIKSLGISLVAVSFTYGGYQQTINFGNEVANPAKNIPKGIFGGILIIISLYLLVNISYYNIIGFTNMQNERDIAYVVVDKILGTKGALIFSFFLFIGVLSYVNALLMSNPRVMYAMSTEGSLPKWFGKENSNGVLTTSLTVFTIICIIILFFSQEFEEILSFTIFLDCFGMIASSATIFKLRKNTTYLNNTGIYQMKLFPLLPIVFMIAYAFVGISIAIDKPQTALIGAGVLLAFMALYFLRKKSTTTH
jgi:APA family basic amino acid/polyamine antiporter